MNLFAAIFIIYKSCFSFNCNTSLSKRGKKETFAK